MRTKEQSQKLRIAVVWTEVPGYLSACLKRLFSAYEIELLVVSDLANRPISSRRAFDDELFDWMTRFYRIQHRSARVRLRRIRDLVWDFQPDVLIIAFQWRYPECYFLIREANRLGIPVIGTMDNPWRDTCNQNTMLLLNRTLKLIPLDAIWVPGERTAQYAQRLFGSRIPIWRGMYSADTELFRVLAEDLQRIESNRTNTFLYVGRFSQEKGVSDLLAAYTRYQSICGADCWGLQMVGDGLMRTEIEQHEGVENLGFMQAHEISKIMRKAGVFVLPSHHEPWGVVLHEAALSGIPILCSDRCGASVELVQNGFNGLTFQVGNIDQLATCMLELSSNQSRRAMMGRNSTLLAQRYSTQLWADTLMRGVHTLRSANKAGEQ